MSPFTHIIARWEFDRWTACFEDSPNAVCDGRTTIEAISQLMQFHGLTHLRMVDRVTVEGAPDIGCMEIRATDGDCPPYPFSSSVN